MEWLLFVAAFLVIIAAVLLLARPKKAGPPSTTGAAEAADYSAYLNQALRFIEFYETLPQKSLFVITPGAIGVAIGNERLGRSIRTYLERSAQSPSQAQQFERAMVERHPALFGGGKGTRLYYELGLSAALHNNDVAWPFLFMGLGEPDGTKRTRYIQDIQKIYRQMYGKRLDIHHLSAY